MYNFKCLMPILIQSVNSPILLLWLMCYWNYLYFCTVHLWITVLIDSLKYHLSNSFFSVDCNSTQDRQLLSIMICSEHFAAVIASAIFTKEFVLSLSVTSLAEPLQAHGKFCLFHII